MLLWLLMLTLPVQGFAAVIRASCETVHSSVQLSAQNEELGEISQHSHHHDDADNVAASMQMTHDHAAGTVHHHQHDLKKASCGSCGSCCVSAFAMMSAHLWAPDFHQASVEIVAPSLLVTGFIPDGLERPPRQISL